MAEKEELEGQIQEQPVEQQTAENATEEVEAGSPPVQEDWSGKLREYEDRLARQEERQRYLEQTNRLLEEHARRSAQPTREEVSLSPELTELDKTLDPLFSKRMKGVIDPLNNHLASALDGNDALRFEMYLMRNHPDVLDSEDGMNKVFQQVEQIRRQAADVYGKYLSRVDAFLYAQGLEGVKEKSKARQTKKQAQVKEEAKRQLQVQAAQSGESRADAKRTGGADVDSIRRRLMAGERLTPEEKAKFRKHLESASF